MSGKLERKDSSWKFDNNQIIEQEDIRKQLNVECKENHWVKEIENNDISQHGFDESGSWVIENNQDALSEYFDEVTDTLITNDVIDFDW